MIPAAGNLFSLAPMPFTEMMYRFRAPELSAHDMTARCPLVAGFEELELGFAERDLGGGVVDGAAMLFAGDEAGVPEREELLIVHRGELRGADGEVRRRDRRVGVFDDRDVAVTGDAHLIGVGDVGAFG